MYDRSSRDYISMHYVHFLVVVVVVAKNKNILKWSLGRLDELGRYTHHHGGFCL